MSWHGRPLEAIRAAVLDAFTTAWVWVRGHCLADAASAWRAFLGGIFVPLWNGVVGSGWSLGR